MKGTKVLTPQRSFQMPKREVKFCKKCGLEISPLTPKVLVKQDYCSYVCGKKLLYPEVR